MKKTVMKIAIIGSLVASGVTMTGCTPTERALAVGVVGGLAVGAAVANSYNYQGHDYGPNRSSMYRAGVRNGCRSADGRWYKNRYRWRNYADYRSGWRNGYDQCR